MRKKLIPLVIACGVALLNAPVMAAEAEMLGRMQQFIEVMQGYFALIEANHSIASDPEKAAILQLQKIQEIYKERGDSAEAVTVLREVMMSTKSPTIRNAAAVLLADTLKESGQTSQAVEVLRDVLQNNIR